LSALVELLARLNKLVNFCLKTVKPLVNVVSNALHFCLSSVITGNLLSCFIEKYVQQLELLKFVFEQKADYAGY